MNQTAPPSEEQLIADIRAKVQRNIRFPILPQSLLKMLFSIDLKEYCDFLTSLTPADDTDYREVYRLLLRYSRLESKSGKGSIQKKPLTVGLMLQKANDLIYHDDEYDNIRDSFTTTELSSVDIGEYIVDMLLIKPVILLELERSKNNDAVYSERRSEGLGSVPY